jgi:hypothetical protein
VEYADNMLSGLRPKLKDHLGILSSWALNVTKCNRDEIETLKNRKLGKTELKENKAISYVRSWVRELCVSGKI